MDALLCDRIIKWYIARRGSPRCCLPAEGEVKVVLPLYGLKSLTRIVEIDGKPWGVVRVFDKIDRRMLAHREALNVLNETHGLPIPHVFDDWAPYNNRIFLSIEQFAAGEPIRDVEVTPEIIDALADTMARLHGVRSERCGFLASPRSASCYPLIRKRMANRLRSIRRRIQDPTIVAQWVRAGKWLSPQLNRLKAVHRFSLVHDKLNPGNMLWQADTQSIVLIDLGTLQYGHPEKDLCQLRAQTLDEDPVKIERFLKRYFSHALPYSREEHEEMEPLFRGYFYMSQVSINGRRLTKLKASETEERKTCQAIIDKNTRCMTQLMDAH